MSLFRLLFNPCALLGSLFWAFGALAQPLFKAENPPVSATLISDHAVATRGSEIEVAVKLSIAKGWHTYWQNPGDTGLPTSVLWELPKGVTETVPMRFPAPALEPFGAFMNYGYTGEVYFLTRFLVDKDAPDTLSFRARVDWLQCADICIPEGANVSLVIPVGKAPLLSEVADTLAQERLALPSPLTGWKASAVAKGATIVLTLTPPSPTTEEWDTLYFFAEHERLIEPSFEQKLTRAKDHLTLTLPVSHQFEVGNTPLRLTGVLRAGHVNQGASHQYTYSTLDLPVENLPKAGAVPRFDHPIRATASTGLGSSNTNNTNNIFNPHDTHNPPSFESSSFTPGWRGFLLTLLSAFLGGMILNLMPCVFPIVSVKALNLVKATDKHIAKRDARYFAIGVMVMFLVLGSVLTALRATGEELGWGFQLQSYLFVLFLIILFFIIALNFSGVFEFGTLRIPFIRKGHSPLFNQHSSGRFSAFFSGVLAVAIASPCTAPFMGAALGSALTQPIYIGFAVFIALGLGMALPYVLLALFPAWQRFLPHSGVWMTRLKQLLAFPIYLTVAWLIWIFVSLTGLYSLPYLLALLPVVACGAFAWQCYRENTMLNKKARFWAILILATFAASCLLLVYIVREPEQHHTSQNFKDWTAYDETELNKLVANGKTVFVDFTAAWCLTCRVNETMVLDSVEVKRAFLDHQILLMRADWTKRDPNIAQALAKLGRSGVPAYVIYRPNQPPQLLPELLRAETVITALNSSP
ncbi:MAG: thioredoxin family protein [Burkholderiales bacterium]|jgi:thiol:disulfide interchange protein DsbD|nr:thioredoxin family protein [Burkholderiales bacterium]